MKMNKCDITNPPIAGPEGDSGKALFELVLSNDNY